MHRILFAMTIFWAFSAPSQQTVASISQAAAGSNWEHAQALPVDTSIQVKSSKSHANCMLKSVDPDSLTCTHGKDLVFQRSEIRSIKISRRGRSALVGLAIGGGTGGIVGAAAVAKGGGWFSDGAWEALGGVVVGTVGGVIGAGIGAATDFTHSTVYKAP